MEKRYQEKHLFNMLPIVELLEEIGKEGKEEKDSE
jgi:hypothetical protein